MSGIYYQFTLNDGSIIKGKKGFCEHFNLSLYQIQKLLFDEKGHFNIEDQKIKYKVMRELIKPRNYIPNPKGRGNSKNNEKKLIERTTYKKIIGSMELEYCGNTGKLIRSKAVII